MINVDRDCHVTSKQPGLISSQLCGLGCSSTDGLSILTIIHDSQRAIVAEWANCRSVWLIAPLVSGVAVTPSWMRRPEARQTH